jgi:hypothetical protein
MHSAHWRFYTVVTHSIFNGLYAKKRVKNILRGGLR